MGQRFQIIIKDGKDYYVYHNQWFYGGTAISFTDQFLKALTKMNFKKALVEAGKKNDFREEPVKFYRYFSSNNSEMEGNDNIEIAKSKDWDAFLKTLDNNDGNLLVDTAGKYCFYNSSIVDSASEKVTNACINASTYFDYYYPIKQLKMGRLISAYNFTEGKYSAEADEDEKKAVISAKKSLDYLDRQPMFRNLSEIPFPTAEKKVSTRRQPLRKDEIVTKDKKIERPSNQKQNYTMPNGTVIKTTYEKAMKKWQSGKYGTGY